MDLLPKETLHLLKSAGFPQGTYRNGTIWYDCAAGKYGVMAGNILNYFDGGYTVLLNATLENGSFLRHPTIEQFLTFTPKARIEFWGGLFSVRIEDDENPMRFTSSNALEACARAYLAYRRVEAVVVADNTIFHTGDSYTILHIGDSCTTSWEGNGEMRILGFHWDYDQQIRVIRLSDSTQYYMRPCDLIAYK